MNQMEVLQKSEAVQTGVEDSFAPKKNFFLIYFFGLKYILLQ